MTEQGRVGVAVGARGTPSHIEEGVPLAVASVAGPTMGDDAVCAPEALYTAVQASTHAMVRHRAHGPLSTRIRADGRRALPLANLTPAPPTRDAPADPPTSWPSSLPYLLSRCVVDAAGCWRFNGTRDAKGYGRAGRHLAHRVVHRLLLGPIPDGWEVDHKCYVTSCVNPEHLEAVTPEENRRRARWHRLVLKAKQAALSSKPRSQAMTDHDHDTEDDWPGWKGVRYGPNHQQHPHQQPDPEGEPE